MDWDDPTPTPKPKATIGESLDTLSVDELDARIAAFTAEIERIKAELAKKRAHESAAAALFKKPGN